MGEFYLKLSISYIVIMTPTKIIQITLHYPLNDSLSEYKDRMQMIDSLIF